MERTVPNVIVADELPATLEQTVAVFTAAGYRVRIAYDGLTALREINRACPDLLIATVSLPIIDGATLAALAQVHGAGVVLTGAADHDPGLPGTAYVAEPGGPAALIAAARRSLAFVPSVLAA